MNNSMKKTILCCAMGAAVGFGASTASAAVLPVTGWTLGSSTVGGGLSDFNFAGPVAGANTFGTDPETGCTNADGSAPTCDDVQFDTGVAADNDINDFSTGFNFGGGGIFQPRIAGAGGSAGMISATIDTVLAAGGDGQALQFSALDFAGIYQGASSFALGPDHLNNCSGNANSGGKSCGGVSLKNQDEEFIGSTGLNLLNDILGYNVAIADIGGGDYDVSVTYIGTITEAGGFLGNEANWKINGTMHTASSTPPTAAVPVPAAAWLFGSGLMGLVGVARRRKTA